MELQERWKFSEGARLLGGCAVTFFVTALMLVLVPAGNRDFGGAWVFWAIWGSLFLLFAVMTVSLIRRFIRGGWFWRERTWREAFLGLGGVFCVGGVLILMIGAYPGRLRSVPAPRMNGLYHLGPGLVLMGISECMRWRVARKRAVSGPETQKEGPVQKP